MERMETATVAVADLRKQTVLPTGQMQLAMGMQAIRATRPKTR